MYLDFPQISGHSWGLHTQDCRVFFFCCFFVWGAEGGGGGGFSGYGN